jgi:hypothetical protein
VMKKKDLETDEKHAEYRVTVNGMRLLGARYRYWNKKDTLLKGDVLGGFFDCSCFSFV